jgi:manganese/zinc/iron transport system substrate-binding protein
MKFKLFIILLLALVANSCDTRKGNNNSKPIILATTGMIGDLVKNIVGDFAEVQVMMGAGVDPHLYKASQGDMQMISDADIIIYNGLHLEGKLTEIFEKTALNKPTIPLGDFIKEDLILKSENAGSSADPHIWMDPKLWAIACEGLIDSLASIYPNTKDDFLETGILYVSELRELSSEVDSLIAIIPLDSRVLVTSHDAFRYFGRAFNIEVKGLQGISTVSEYGLRDVKNMTDIIISRKIKAVFVESSVSSKSLESVIEGCIQEGHEVKIGGMLFSDSMGKPGTEQGTYLGMIRSNAIAISNSLR